jgi:pyrimidine-nucleoside phosphorylase
MAKKISKTTLSPASIIAKKRDGHELSEAEIKSFISGLLSGEIANYQMTALLMAITLKGMTTAETAALTDAMLYSGEVLKFKNKNANAVVDKHSTGGVGDKASFILAPLAAACGVYVPMIAGRGLGHTGGTIDKVEAVKGFNTSLSLQKFEELLFKNKLVLIGQTKEIAPADKIIYGLRDVTATVESIPLITASIMSKKLAEGAKGIVMDIKTGSGAFMKNPKDAKALAKSIAMTGNRFGKHMMTMITDMSEPLGNYIGNSLEIIESIETLKGNGPKDLTDLSVELAAGMVLLAKKAKDMKQARDMVWKALESGEALRLFRVMLEEQGGQASVVDDYSLLPVAKEKTIIKSKVAGYVQKMDCKSLGLFCVDLGGGRKKTDDIVDPSVGFIMHKKIGDKIVKGEALFTVYHHANQKDLVKNFDSNLAKAEVLVIGKSKPKAKKLILEQKTYWA